ncbi:hypothetical protein [Streptomyces sp. NPDC047453]|uniref:hypothetical protein n=1 Tax=Streptomyces sp. NPDC047453 TaxID=3154812 RepID=UPI0033C39A4A
MGTETDWVYRVFEPHGSEGWRPYGSDPERWRGTITADDSSEGPQYALSLVVADLMTEWKVCGLHRAKHVRVYLWRDEEGDREDADAIVEVRPSIHAELPASGQALVRLSLFRFGGHAWCGGQTSHAVVVSSGGREGRVV